MDKPLADFTTEDLRIMIGQSIGLEYLVPLAIKELQLNILAHGDFYEGDLLQSIFFANPAYWKNHVDQWRLIKGLYEKNKIIFESDNLYKKLRSSFELFAKINDAGL